MAVTMNDKKIVAGDNTIIQRLDDNVQKITNILIELAQDDKTWWEENLRYLASQPLDSLKQHLAAFQDTSLDGWSFYSSDAPSYSILDPIESLTWLAGLCRLDRVLIGALPRDFVDEFELQWRVWALYWV
jgi:hypothetical protein